MEHLDKKRKITIMLAIMAAMFFATVNQTIVGTAMPRIIAQLGGMEYYSWVFTIYMLTSSITTILVGRLSDIYGRKPFMLIGIGIFIVGAFLSGTSNTIIQLIIYRAIQGFGAGLIMSTSFTAVGDLFSPRERGRWQGLMGAVFGISSVLGPVLGGYIVDYWEWHWVFWVFLPLGIVAFAMIWTLFPSVKRERTATVDYYGSLFLTITIVTMLLAFSWAGLKYAWGSVQIIGLLGISMLSFIFFMLVERKAINPVLPLSLFKNSIVTITNLIGLVMGAGMFGVIMYMPYFIQGVLGESAMHSSYIMIPMTLSLVAGSALSGQLMSKTGKYKLLTLVGIFITFAGLYLMTQMHTDTTTLQTVFNNIVAGFGLGIIMPIITLAAQNAVDHSELGVVTAASQLFRNLGGTIGVAVMGTVLAQRLQSKMQELATDTLEGNIANLTPETSEKLNELFDPQVLLDPSKLEEIQRSIPPEMNDLFLHLISMLKESLNYALSGVFLTGALALLFAFLLTFLLKEIPLRSTIKMKEKNESNEKKVINKLEGQGTN